MAGKTGRHTFVNWDQVLTREGAHHPAMNPYAMPENAGLRRDIPDGFGERSLRILERSVMIPMDPPDHTEDDLETLSAQHPAGGAGTGRPDTCARPDLPRDEGAMVGSW